MAKTAQEYLAELRKGGVSNDLLFIVVEMLGKGSAAMDMAKKVRQGLNEHGIPLAEFRAALEVKPQPAATPPPQPTPSPVRHGCAPQKSPPRLGSPFGPPVIATA